MHFESVCVVGLGYIGLPTAAMFASAGVKVVGVDINESTVDTINAGRIHIIEPGLEAVVQRVVTEGYLEATTSPKPSDAFIIAVPTPLINSKDSTLAPVPDTSYIEAAAKAVATVLKKGDLVILESTSPVGTTELMASWLAVERSDLTFPNSASQSSDVRIAYCPERVLPGNIIAELVNNDRVIGGMTEKCSFAARQLYEAFVEGHCITTDVRVAEMAKLTENASRDVGIAFANELSIICDEQDIDVWELIRVANRHPRVNILQPGPGVGGHCIAVDPWFIVDRSPATANLIRTAREINDQKPNWVLNKIKLAVSELLLRRPAESAKRLTIACYGLAFKANVDDLRESPAVKVAEQVIDLHPGVVLLVEPNIKTIPHELSGAELTNFESAIEKADVHVLLVDHAEFSTCCPDAGIVVDTRGIWSVNN